MKKLVFRVILTIIPVIALFAGCKPSSEPEQFSKADVEKIKAWDKFFIGSQATGARAFDKPVPTALADQCTVRYRHIYKKPVNILNLKAISDAYTHSASFGSKNLSDWALDMSTHTNATHIKVCLGIYYGGILNSYPTELAQKAGRLTVFLYPFDANGNLAVYNAGLKATGPAQPFNFAGLEP